VQQIRSSDSSIQARPTPAFGREAILAVEEEKSTLTKTPLYKSLYRTEIDMMRIQIQVFSRACSRHEARRDNSMQ
jgi:hypothetical protein